MLSVACWGAVSKPRYHLELLLFVRSPFLDPAISWERISQHNVLPVCLSVSFHRSEKCVWRGAGYSRKMLTRRKDSCVQGLASSLWDNSHGEKRAACQQPAPTGHPHHCATLEADSQAQPIRGLKPWPTSWLQPQVIPYSNHPLSVISKSPTHRNSEMIDDCFILSFYVLGIICYVATSN